MDTLLLFLLFPEFSADKSSFYIPRINISAPANTNRIGNLVLEQGWCRVEEKFDLVYNDKNIQNSLHSENGERSFYAFYHAFPESFAPQKQREKLAFLVNGTGKKCSDFIVSMVRHDIESDNWIFEIVDLTDFSYNIYLNNALVAKFDSYFQSEGLSFSVYFSEDKKNIITRVSSREPDASEITPMLNKKIQKITGYYWNDKKVSDDLVLTHEDIQRMMDDAWK